MNSIIITKTYSEPPFNKKEILRYAGCKSLDNEILSLIDGCIENVRSKLSYKVCYRELPIAISDDICDLGAFKVQSKHLAKNLNDCGSVIIFAATIGVDIDRLIARYGHISPSKALLLQAIGSERIEALCDAFCQDIAREKNTCLRPRFSPGYGDVSLDTQKDIFAVLDCWKRVGISLSDSLLMSPSKSVTAFVGIGGKAEKNTDKCNNCDNKDCSFRGVL